MSEREQFLWVEKYRPHTIKDCVLPETLKASFQSFLEADQLPNLLLAGSAGVGKTTVARALCEELGCDYIVVNASEDGGISTLRDKIRNFASSVSLSTDIKVVILDEADYLNPNSTQPALRGFIEEFAQHCRFIFTCNFKNRIIEPLHSRCTVIEFSLTKDDKPVMAAAFMKRVESILKAENIPYSRDVVAKVLLKYFPDYRRVLNELQRYAISGSIDDGILNNLEEINLLHLVKTLREKNFTEMRKWIAQNGDNDPNRLIRTIFDAANTHVLPKSIPSLVLILADYQAKVPFVADQELNMTAMLTEVMAGVEFKD